jgi:hypothetical protein
LEVCPRLLAILVIFSRPAAVSILMGGGGVGAFHGSEEGNLFWVISNPWQAQVYRIDSANKEKRERVKKTEKHKDSV